MVSDTHASNTAENKTSVDIQSQLYIYDSMSGKKRKFVPLQVGKVSMYVCGMTVYDYCHIGHGRTVVAFDVMVRWLRELGYAVNYVRNITDIDDKIIVRANENGESINSLTERFIAAMAEDMTALGCLAPDHEPRATEYIDDMQQMIGTLVDTQFAYAADNGDVYYAVDKFDGYGKLSGRKLEDMQAGARIEVQSVKRNPFDFVLWKSAKPNEPKWHSVWGDGRPGWHIECSAMSRKCLGDTFDIHGGGYDLQFPHHENEIAQSEAVTGCTYANNWIHVGFINVDNEKMSKSLGNFFTIRDVREKYHPEVIRFFILSSHYRSQVNFSSAALDEAQAALDRLYQALRSAEQLIAMTDSASIRDTAIAKNSLSKENINNDVFTTKIGKAFAAAMNDDFNTSLAISVLFGVAKDLNKAITAEDINQTCLLRQQLQALSASLNILQNEPVAFLQSHNSGNHYTKNELTDQQIETMIAQRIQAKSDKDFGRADDIRASLKEQGIELEDNKHGTSWRRGN